MRMRYTLGVGLVLMLGIALVGLGEDNDSQPFVVENIELPDSVVEAVETTFKERGALSSDILDTSGNFGIESETTLSMTFVGEGAGYKNSVGYFTFDSLGVILEQHIVFENFSGAGKGLAGGGDLIPGDTVEIGTFAPGVNVGFFLLANGFRKKNAPMWTTLEDLNVDGKDHDAVLPIADAGLLIGFEDLRNLGDRDYNDALLLITAVVMAIEEDPEDQLGQRRQSLPSLFEQALLDLSVLLSVSSQEAREIVQDHGLFAVRRALAASTDPDAFWGALLGYDVVGAPTAIGGGGEDNHASLFMDFQLHHPVTGELVEDEHVTVTIVRQPNNVIDVVVVPFNPETECYSLDLRGLNLDPGTYDLHLGFGNKTAHQLMSIVIPAVG
jgi:hypothetical protein